LLFAPEPIEQTRVVDVHMSGDWLAGEY